MSKPESCLISAVDGEALRGSDQRELFSLRCNKSRDRSAIIATSSRHN